MEESTGPTKANRLFDFFKDWSNRKYTRLSINIVVGFFALQVIENREPVRNIAISSALTCALSLPAIRRRQAHEKAAAHQLMTDNTDNRSILERDKKRLEELYDLPAFEELRPVKLPTSKNLSDKWLYLTQVKTEEEQWEEIKANWERYTQNGEINYHNLIIVAIAKSCLTKLIVDSDNVDIYVSMLKYLSSNKVHPEDISYCDTADIGSSLWNALVKGVKLPIENQSPEDEVSSDNSMFKNKISYVKFRRLFVSMYNEAKEKYGSINP